MPMTDEEFRALADKIATEQTNLANRVLDATRQADELINVASLMRHGIILQRMGIEIDRC